MGTLFVVATPIGNLGDITKRALETLKEADVVLAEDTRVTKKLFSPHKITTPLVSYHQHSKESVQKKIAGLLSAGKNIALVTDAGTPGVSDPGNELISFLLKENPEARIVPVPGACALTAMASIAGISMDKFLFLGYPPAKKGRKKFFEEIVKSKHPVVFYESPHRIVKSLKELEGTKSNLSVVAGRELTKKFETILRGSLSDIIAQLEKSKVRGEFAVLVDMP